MTVPVLRADCASCAALCCVAPAFDQSSQFAFSKQAGIPCPNLGADHGCTIHTHLGARGFGGCVQFDCLGAGQYVVQDIFNGRSWRDDPTLGPRMFEAFRVMRQVYEALQLLQLAAGLPLSLAQQAERDRLEVALWPAAGWSENQLGEFEASALPAAIAGFLKGLRANIPEGQRHRG